MRLIKFTPRQIAEKYVIDDIVYSNIKIHFGFDKWACDYTLMTLMPISTTGRYCVVFLSGEDDVLYYSDYLGNHIIDFIENEIIKFLQIINRDGEKLTVNPSFYFEDDRKVKWCKENEFINSL